MCSSLLHLAVESRDLSEKKINLVFYARPQPEAIVYCVFALVSFFFYYFSLQTPLWPSNDPIDILRDGVKDEDLESEGLIIQFDFNSIITVKNQSKDEKNEEKSFEHITLLHKKSREILIEPLVAVYLNLKWQSLKGWWFAYRLLFFLAFGVCLTLLISFIVEMNSDCNFQTEVSNKTVIGELLKKVLILGQSPRYNVTIE